MVQSSSEAAAIVTRDPLSAVVITYNRETIIRTCLKALSLADEVVVVDKSSTDRTPDIAREHADRVLCVPWSPVVEDTRAYAVGQCSHPWILLLDDDECLSAEAALFIERELVAPRADAYSFMRRNYVLGAHDERAYYWPEQHVHLFRKSSVNLGATVHSGVQALSGVFRVEADRGVCIHHLSHADVAQWIEKTNRYTSQPNRMRVADEPSDLLAFAHARLDHWTARNATSNEPYLAAVAILRGVYDIVDHIKSWEEGRGLDGAALLADVCQRLEADYTKQLGSIARPRTSIGGARQP